MLLAGSGSLLAQSGPYQTYPPPQYPNYDGNPAGPPSGQANMNGPQGGEDVQGDQQRGIARLSIVQGDVNINRGDSGGLVAAVVNAPLATGDHLQTSPGSRAEAELDSANLVRLAPNTDVAFADLEYHRYQLQLGAGTIEYRVLRPQDAQAEVDTPSIAARPLGPGAYRIAVLDDGTTQITVRSGELEISSPRGSERIDPGKTVLVRGDASDPELLDTAEIAPDQFDDWCQNRDRTLLASQSYQYVSPDVPGADDLDAYGNWVPSQYGNVWEPQVPYSGWSPYSEGDWTWEPYYGWTWVDAEPWGWAPFHYGRWFWNGGYGWCWWPGALHVHAYWSPALVGFFGWGGLGVGFGGGIGWVPLAPFEVLHPWWGFHRDFYGRYWSGYGAWSHVDIARLYRNAAIRGGAMVVGYDRFGLPGARFNAANMAQLRQATFFRSGVPVSPTRAAYQFSNRRARPNPRLAVAEQRRFFSGSFRNQPMRAAQSSLGMQRAFGTGPYARQPYRGWQRFGDPGTGNSYRQNFLNQGERSGWHQFGAPEHSPPAGFAAPRPSYGRPNYAFPAPRYTEPRMPRYGAPSAPHFSMPSIPRSSGPRFSAPRQSAPHFSQPSRSSGGFAPRGGEGGGHAPSGGRRGR
jgi:hypothetical protein